jgi:ABC-type branched-subunit amino acid transport system ATPase component
MENLLVLDDVWAGYTGDDVLRGLGLEIEAGSITCIVGPNGAGKSTLSRVVSGLLRPRRGRVIFRGQSTVGMTPRGILDLGIVQVPQERSVFPGMTVLENVRLGGFSLSDRGLFTRRLAAVIEAFPIVKEFGRQPIAALSGGQQKMVEFARVMMLEPMLLVVDEPGLGLDPRSRAAVYETVRQLNQRDCTILLVEQNVRAGLQLASHGVVMQNGRVALTGTGSEILARPDIGDLLLGGAAASGTV